MYKMIFQIEKRYWIFLCVMEYHVDKLMSSFLLKRFLYQSATFDKLSGLQELGRPMPGACPNQLRTF